MDAVHKLVDALPGVVAKHLHLDGAAAQTQDKQPGQERLMSPAPVYIRPEYRGAGKLLDKVCLVTGGDSGIGRAVAVHFAREGADIAFLYLDEENEDEDAKETVRLVGLEGRRCISFAGDVADPLTSMQVVEKVLAAYGKIDCLVNNAATAKHHEKISQLKLAQWDRTFKTNIDGYFLMAQAVEKHLSPGASIINTSSSSAYQADAGLLDYSSSAGAIISFTRSLAMQLSSRGIRVNAVAPGPVWTPLIQSSLPADKVAQFGKSVPLGRYAQPCELAPTYVLIAGEDGAYFSGQTFHPNGGVVING